MINKISSVSYKNALIQGIQRRFQFTPKIEDLDSILTPFELKELLRKIPADFFDFGADFKNVKTGNFRVNLHIHTKKSDGSMSPEEYLEQSVRYADEIARLKERDSFPFYISATTDHNNCEASQEVIAMIADNPKKYKNFKFAAGCEFMFLDEQSGFKFPAFEAVGLGINPFSQELLKKISAFNPIKLINKIKEFGAILSYAHPARFAQGNGVHPDFIKYLKRIGINGIESNYQYIGIKSSPELSAQICESKRIAAENDWFETGGTDTHGKNIFHQKAQKIIDSELS